MGSFRLQLSLSFHATGQPSTTLLSMSRRLERPSDVVSVLRQVMLALGQSLEQLAEAAGWTADAAPEPRPGGAGGGVVEIRHATDPPGYTGGASAMYGPPPIPPLTMPQGTGGTGIAGKVVRLCPLHGLEVQQPDGTWRPL